MTAPSFPAKSTGRTELLLVGLVFVVGVILTYPIPVLLLDKPPKFALWFDQGQYLASARALLHGDLAAARHWYPLLYPLLLAPIAWLPSLLQTTLVDLVCFLATFLGFREVAGRIGLAGWRLVALFLVSTVLWPRLGSQWLLPWTTTPSAALIWLALASTSRTLDREAARAMPLRSAALLGAMLALIPLGRPGDAPVAAIVGAIAGIGLLRHGRRWRVLGAMAAAGLAVAAAGLALHLAIYGARPSPYMLLSRAYGANFSWIGWKAYLLLVEPRPWYPEGEGLLRVLPWLPAGLAGLLLLLADPRRRMLGLLLLLPALAYAAVMLAYIDLLPSGLWKFNNVHYFKWLVPVFVLGLAHWLAILRRAPARALLALAPLLALGALRLEPVAVAGAAPARLVAFAGVAAEVNRVYFARSSIGDAAGPMRNYFEYHQVPAPGQGLVLAEALRRDFAGNEQWFDPARGVAWPFNPMEIDEAPLPGVFPRAPLARYAPALTIGWPCWLPPYACPVALPRPDQARNTNRRDSAKLTASPASDPAATPSTGIRATGGKASTSAE